MKTLTAYTFEIDEPDLAVSEILEQLDLENNLCKYSVGLLSCYAEFIETGVVRQLCAKMPFDVIGCTTMANGTAGELGHLMLCLTILTSDDIKFSTALSAPLETGHVEPLRAAYQNALDCLGGVPSLMITYAPMIEQLGGETMVNLLNQVSGGLPNFGTVGIDHTVDYHETRIIYNGEAYKTSLALLLIEGDFSPVFYIGSISEGKTQKQKAIITASKDNVLMEVNNMSAVEYLETLGLSKDGGIKSAVTIPFIVDQNDGTKPVVRSIYMLSKEGYAFCGGNMPVNSTLAIGYLDYDEVMTTTSETLNKVLAEKKHNGIIMYTCLGRTLVLGTDSTAELELIRDRIVDYAPYQVCYSGGEICPVCGEDGTLVNRFHNNTLVACVF